MSRFFNSLVNIKLELFCPVNIRYPFKEQNSLYLKKDSYLYQKIYFLIAVQKFRQPIVRTRSYRARSQIYLIFNELPRTKLLPLEQPEPSFLAVILQDGKN